jgi:hypothetical protein
MSLAVGFIFAISPGRLPNETGRRASDKGFLSMSAEEYLSLVDWTGRQMVRGCGRAMPNPLPPRLVRVGIASDDWLLLVSRFGRLFQRVAGAPYTLARLYPARPLRPGQATLLARGKSSHRV